MEAVLNGLFALAGSLGTGLLALLGSKVQAGRDGEQRKADADEKDKQRVAEAEALKLRLAAEAAERAEQRESDELTDRRAQIHRWRDGLAASHADYLAWEKDDEARDPAAPTRTRPPNILTAGWFMALRPHLQRVNEGWLDAAMDDDEIQCDNDTANLLLGEIARLEREWLGTGNYRMPGRPSRWVRE